MAAARLLKKNGLSRSLFDPVGVVRGLDMLGDAPLVVVGSAVFPKGKESYVSKILSVARKLVTHHGAGNITTLVDLLAGDGLDPPLTRRYLNLDDSLVWLDAGAGMVFPSDNAQSRRKPHAQDVLGRRIVDTQRSSRGMPKTRGPGGRTLK